MASILDFVNLNVLFKASSGRLNKRNATVITPGSSFPRAEKKMAGSQP